MVLCVDHEVDYRPFSPLNSFLRRQIKHLDSSDMNVVNKTNKQTDVGREHRLTQFMAQMMKSTTSGLKLQLLAHFSPACVLSCSDPAAPCFTAPPVSNPLSACLITELTWDQQINQRPAVRCERRRSGDSWWTEEQWCLQGAPCGIWLTKICLCGTSRKVDAAMSTPPHILVCPITSSRNYDFDIIPS